MFFLLFLFLLFFYGCKDENEEYLEIVFFDDNYDNKITQLTDSRDGQSYKIINIGFNLMAENLNYNAGNGCWIYNNDSSNAEIYGRLYDWETAKNACPDGWHLPDNDEWAELFAVLGGSDIAGGKMKSTGTILWNYPNTGATNSSGFSALPGGGRDDNGNFRDMNYKANFLSSTEYNSGNAYLQQLGHDYEDVGHYYGNKDHGYSVRCVRD